MYHEITIKPTSGGFGEYEAGTELSDGWADETDLHHEMAGNVDEMVELGVDEIPEEVEDIRGRIRNAPDRVFACRLGDYWSYHGIVFCN